jgi:peroxiredoxin
LTKEKTMTRLLVIIVTVMGIGQVAHADAAGDELRDKIAEAYREVKDYRSTVSFQVLQKSGRWTNTQSAELFVAMDRDASRLSFDKPDMKLVIDQGKLLLNSPDLRGRHLDVAAPAFDLEAIMQVTPFINRPMAPDLAFLTAKDPIAALGGDGELVSLPIEEARPGLQFDVEGGVMVLRINPTTHLIETVVQTVDVAAMGGEPGDAVTITYRIDAKAGDKAGDDAFAMDLQGSTAAGSLQELFAGGGGQGDAGIEGQDAPEIELTSLDGKAFKLSQAKEKVIVLDFWATWCPPCVQALPKLQSVHDWAAAEGKDVAIYAVNLQELPEQVRDFWAKHKLTMPVLMDREGAAAEDYQVQSIPQTFVISGGKVAHVHVGFDPGMDEALKKQIDELLAQ